MNKEDLLQQKCVIWFKNNYQMHGKGLIFAVPNGGTRNIIEAKKLKATGTMPGVSDLIVVLDSKVLFIELKTDIGKQSDAQIIFETKITNLNHEYILIRNEEEFKNAILSRIGNREK
ncbi:VRR-NUC domain-containing protein [Flavobacterium phage vB_FspS_snusmum6-1]|uniref:VRR-NUC domain-containing protein n=3 Tax=Muminvirus snusmum TaxID=2844298 RepID=A0A6B9LR00_9CAUD|nr:VRR-NUC domain-containing protein [Flavobacterium phage vB_FspS_snusmum6-1]QHB40620.1 VRR-NUC domain-containing protein [Flavobacterium phage vB_FspS_snusmum6-1]QHB40692.1 VRR-NUC domain-containing protein [Flavobacterium phage vB_FspS_snusmum6-2]QHB40765.1 VRR-NUC domain-containing protein [Flavobacterium phage vB_FspS_snusmum6-3]